MLKTGQITLSHAQMKSLGHEGAEACAEVSCLTATERKLVNQPEISIRCFRYQIANMQTGGLVGDFSHASRRGTRSRRGRTSSSGTQSSSGLTVHNWVRFGFAFRGGTIRSTPNRHQMPTRHVSFWPI